MLFYLRDPDALLAVPETIRRAVCSETEPEFIAKRSDVNERIRRSGYRHDTQRHGTVATKPKRKHRDAVLPAPTRHTGTRHRRLCFQLGYAIGGCDLHAIDRAWVFHDLAPFERFDASRK